MPTIQLELDQPHAGQQKMRAEARRFNVAACGRQIGKTTLAQQLVIETALAGKAVSWFNPTYKSNDSAWDAIKDTLQPLVTDTNEQARRLGIQGGGSIECGPWPIPTAAEAASTISS